MGTRHLIGVVVDGDFKVAQYGQWDGYPEGAGVSVLAFLRSADLADFAECCRSLRWQDDDDQAAIDAKWKSLGVDVETGDGWVSMDKARAFYADPRFAHLNRDVGSDILGLVASGNLTFVRDDRSFALDSLFCEYAYVVDLDRGVLEAYQGFQKSPPESGRWAHLCSPGEEYAAIALAAEFKLDDLPSDEEFCVALHDEEAE